MNRYFLWPGAFALALIAMPPARAASDAELAEIRAQIRALRQSYEARLQALEQRLQEAEAKAAAAPPPVASAPPAPASPSTAASAFNPAISAVLQGHYANLSRNPEGYAIHGFAPGGDIGPGKRGFNLAESEMGLAASVDDRFTAQLIASLAPDNTVSVEEAYGILTAAPAGLVPKFGRFFSGIGYVNEQHPHAYDFRDAPLAYDALLGGKYVQDGVQLKWLAPLEQYLELGIEAGSGSGFPGTAQKRNGAGSGALYAHAGGDVGESSTWRAGLSWLRTRASGREWSQSGAAGRDARLSFDGTGDTALADFVWKWAPGGNATERSFKLQGEYLRRRERGDLAYEATGISGPVRAAPYRSDQSGWYLQGIYQFLPAWRAGARYDRLSTGSVNYGANGAFLTLEPFTPRRATVMLDYTPSEFSRFRAQFARSEVQPGLAENQVFLQYILTLGAHGAHRY